MDILSLIFMLLGMAAVTYGVRVVFFLPGIGERLPPALRQAMAYVPVAVLSAIIVPEVFVLHGQIQISLLNPSLWGMLATGVVMWRSKRLLLAIGAGMAAYYAMRWIAGI
ncbi:AzlD domain-containing protein [Chitinibacter sp. S2-10]|uniref:AzlD domain-containing protein n=1 Tax=Chitinibacter sp. S2-10 TaxID=3373597 RepID=UPI0039779D28